MKIRTGFVSNSSSSSFIAAKDIPFDCPIEAAHHMIIEREWPSDADLIQKLVLLTRAKTIDASTNLCFSSVNYDTYIYNTEEGLGIYTCNNIDWKFPVGVKIDSIDGGGSGTENKEFVMIETGERGRRITDVEADEIVRDVGNHHGFYCKTCYTNLWIREIGVSGNWSVTCPKCVIDKYIKPFGEKQWRVFP